MQVIQEFCVVLYLILVPIDGSYVYCMLPFVYIYVFIYVHT